MILFLGLRNSLDIFLGRRNSLDILLFEKEFWNSFGLRNSEIFLGRVKDYFEKELGL